MNRVFLELISPPELGNPSLPLQEVIHEPAKAFLSAAAGLLTEEPKATISCELWATSTSIRFIASLPTTWKDSFVHHLYASYPHAQVCLVDPPSLDVSPEAPSLVGNEVWFQPSDQPLACEQPVMSDSMQPILETLGRLPASSRVVIQLTLAAKDRPKSLLGKIASQVGQTTKEELHAMVFGRKIVNDDESTNEKLDQVLFQANLRILIAGSGQLGPLLHQITAGYHQFSQPNGAQLKSARPKHLTRFLTAVAERTYQPKSAFQVTLDETICLYHLPAKPATYPLLHQLSSVELPPPTFPASAGLILGESSYRGQHEPVVLTADDRLRHLYLIGQTGTGKSTLFQSAILGDIERGDGCCFIDPHGEVIDWLLPRIPEHRIQDVLLFDPSDARALLGLNLLEWQTADERDRLIQELIYLFYKLFDPTVIGPQFEHWLRNAALTITEPGVRGTLIDIPRLFSDQAFRDRILPHVVHPAAQTFWHDQMAETAAFHKSEMLNYFTSKFGAFSGNQTMQTILGQRQSAFSLRTIMDRRKIFLVNLSKGKIGDLNAQLLGIILLIKLQTAALSRADTVEAERAPFYVYIDEFHTIATDSFAGMFSELRKYRVGLNVTHQYAAQLSEPLRQAIIGNIGTLLAFRLGREDADWLAPHFAPLTQGDLTNIPAHHLHIRTLIQGLATTPFTLRSLQPEGKVRPENAQAIRNRMRAFVRATTALRDQKLQQPQVALVSH